MDTGDQIVVKVGFWNKVLYISVFLGALGLVFTGASTAFSTRNTKDALDVANRIEASAECRFDESAIINETNDLMDYWIGEALKALGEENDADFQEAIEQYELVSGEYLELVTTRGTIAERCNALSEGDE